MSLEVERIKKLVGNDMVVDAVELPANHTRKVELVHDLEDALSKFDDNVNYAHFVVRVRRSDKPITIEAAEQAQEESVSFDSLVNETMDLGREITEKREIEKQKKEEEETDPAYLFSNAKILEENGEHALARKIYKTLIKKGTMIAKAIAGIARTFEAEGQVKEAIRFYQEAIAYSSEVEFYHALTALQIRLEMDAEAAETLLRALGVPGISETQKFDFYKSLGNCYTRLGMHDKAEHHYLQAYEINADSDVLQVNVGSLALQKNEIAAAKKHFERALELNSQNDKAFAGLGMAEMNKGDIHKAHEFFRKSLEINPNNLNAMFNLVKCAYQIRNFAVAAQYLSASIAAAKEPNINILYSYAGILYHQDQYGAARIQIERILEKQPGHGGAKDLLELIEKKSG